jgi:hypothetical protein
MNAAKNFNNLSQREQVEYLQRLEKALADYAKTVQIQE